MFVGTIRYNLDPFHKHTDAELWDAMDKAHMKAAVQATPDGLSAAVRGTCHAMAGTIANLWS